MAARVICDDMLIVGDLLRAHFVDERRKQTQRGDDRGRDGEALGEGLGGVAHRIEVRHDLVGALVDVTVLVVQGTAHLEDAVGIIGDGAIGVHGQDIAGRCQQPDTG